MSSQSYAECTSFDVTAQYIIQIRGSQFRLHILYIQYLFPLTLLKEPATNHFFSSKTMRAPDFTTQLVIIVALSYSVRSKQRLHTSAGISVDDERFGSHPYGK